MKAFLVLVVLLIAVAAGGYFGLPLLIDRQIEPLKKDVREIKTKLENVEQFVRQEQDLRKSGALPPDAGMNKVIGSLNAVASRIDGLDKALARQESVGEGALKKERDEREQAVKKQAQDLEKLKKTAQEALQEAGLRSEIGQIRDYLLKIKIDVTSRNVGTAKNDLRKVQRALEKLGSRVPEGVKPTVEEVKENVEKAASDVDTDLAAASDRINIAWRELEKLVATK